MVWAPGVEASGRTSRLISGGLRLRSPSFLRSAFEGLGPEAWTTPPIPAGRGAGRFKNSRFSLAPLHPYALEPSSGAERFVRVVRRRTGLYETSVPYPGPRSQALKDRPAASRTPQPQDGWAGGWAQPKKKYVTRIAAMAPARSAARPQPTAWRVLRMPTEPK